MKVLLTGSSGQIGTNLALRLLADGHEVFGVDQRVNTWTDDFRYLIQDLSGQYPAFPDGIGGVPYPETDVVVHLAAHAKVHQLVAHPHRALENTMMTFNVLEYCRQRRLPLVFSSTREVYGDVHRFEGYGEDTADFAFTESPYSASKIASEAFIYAYARCYGLKYIAFRFSNVYGRYDNDLHRMSRVLPLFIHSMSRDEPITVFGGADKVLDFTYVDDCVDGISRGIEALVDGRVTNETINLAFGEGNTLVRAAELIAAELDVEPKMTIAPSLLGEVTRYVADIRKAHDLLGWTPQVPLDEGIPRAVAWFQEHRAAHPDEDRPVVNEGDSVGWKTLASRSDLASSRIFGPTASGKTAVAEAIAERIPGRARLRRLDAGLPRPADPDEPGRRRAARRDLAARPPGDGRRVPGSSRTRRSTRSPPPGRTPIVVGGSGLWFQAALTDVRLPADAPAGREGALGASLRPPRRRDCARDPRAPRPTCGGAGPSERPQARRPGARALGGGRHARARSSRGSGPPSSGCRRSSSASTSSRETLAARIRARARAMFEQGVEEEVRAAGDVAPQVLGLDAVRTLPREEAIAELERATLRFAAYQRKWMRRIPGIVMIDAERPAGEVADAILEVARAR